VGCLETVAELEFEGGWGLTAKELNPKSEIGSSKIFWGLSGFQWVWRLGILLVKKKFVLIVKAFRADRVDSLVYRDSDAGAFGLPYSRSREPFATDRRADASGVKC
jgi:hypothetical protein